VNFRISSATIALAFGAAFFLTACDAPPPPPPKTYPVKGKVVFIGGGSPSGGSVDFRSTTDMVTAVGKVEADGTFVLQTLSSREKVNGAVEGEHTVTYTPGQGQDQSTLLPVTAAEKYRVKAEENNITVTVAKPRPPQ